MPAAAACRGSRGSPRAVPTLSMFSLGPRGHAIDLILGSMGGKGSHARSWKVPCPSPLCVGEGSLSCSNSPFALQSQGKSKQKSDMALGGQDGACRMGNWGIMKGPNRD